MPRVTAQHEEATRQRILEAALRAFERRGFHEATIQDVVRESGLSVGAIYTYFSGKEELLLAACENVIRTELEALAVLLADAPTARQKLEIAVRFWFEVLDRRPDPAVLMSQAWGSATQQPAIRAMLVRRREQLVAVGVMLIREGIQRGELPDRVDVDGLARGFSAMLDGLMLQRLEEGDAYRRAAAERRAMTFVELLFAAAAADAAPAASPAANAARRSA